MRYVRQFTIFINTVLFIYLLIKNINVAIYLCISFKFINVINRRLCYILFPLCPFRHSVLFVSCTKCRGVDLDLGERTMRTLKHHRRLCNYVMSLLLSHPCQGCGFFPPRLRFVRKCAVLILIKNAVVLEKHLETKHVKKCRFLPSFN